MATDPDLLAIWTILDTEATTDQNGLHAVSTGLAVAAGEILAGVDAAANRHLLVPLLPGEAFAQDLTGSAVQLHRITESGTTYLSAVCLIRDLDDIFIQFARELSRELPQSQSPAKDVVGAFALWKKLFADAMSQGGLTEPQQIGLLAELQLLERIVVLDPERDLEVWTGPDRSQHDFRRGTHAVEVKATLAREGRRIGISSVEQLNSPPGVKLILVHTRFERDATGDSLPLAVDRVLALSVGSTAFEKLLLAAGYRQKHAPLYASHRYRTVDQRFYDVQDPAFPKIAPASFQGGVLPPGIENLSYTIDISNEPPFPLSQAAASEILSEIAAAQ